MIFYCAFCSIPLKTGTMVCQCGQIFPHPVPAEGDQIGASYWPPRQLSLAEDNVRRIRELWENVPAAGKAIGFGVLAVVLIAFAVIGHRSPLGTPGDESAAMPPPHTGRVVQAPTYQQPPQASIPSPPHPVVVGASTSAPQKASISVHYDFSNWPVGPGGTNVPSVWITNNDRFDWSNVTVIINPGYGDYTERTPIIPPSANSIGNGLINGAKVWSYSDFADPYGNRMPENIKINRIQLACDTPAGRVTFFTTMFN